MQGASQTRINTERFRSEKNFAFGCKIRLAFLACERNFTGFPTLIFTSHRTSRMDDSPPHPKSWPLALATIHIGFGAWLGCATKGISHFDSSACARRLRNGSVCFRAITSRSSVPPIWNAMTVPADCQHPNKLVTCLIRHPRDVRDSIGSDFCFPYRVRAQSVTVRRGQHCRPSVSRPSHPLQFQC